VHWEQKGEEGARHPAIGGDIRFGKGCMNGRRANLDGHGGVEGRHGSLERLQRSVFIGENTKLSVADTDGDTAGQVVLVGAKPGVALGLFEDVVQGSVVSVVIHSSSHWES
jgi:hypothetical protein